MALYRPRTKEMKGALSEILDEVLSLKPWFSLTGLKSGLTACCTGKPLRAPLRMDKTRPHRVGFRRQGVFVQDLRTRGR